MRRRATAGLAAGVLSLVCVAGAARGQEQAPPPAPSPGRSGILLGGGLGWGSMAFQVGDSDPEKYDESFALNLWFGGMIPPRAALGVELFTTSQSQDDPDLGGTITISQPNFGAFLRFWVLRRLWIQGGINTARAKADTEYDDGTSIKGVGVSGAAGFEILSQLKWSLDIALRLSAASYRDDSDLKSQSVTLTGDFNWWF